MNMQNKKETPVTVDEILANTQGEVSRMLELILNAPDLQTGDHITVAVEKWEKRQKAFLEVFHYFSSILASIRQHETNPEIELSKDAATYLNDLKHGCPPDKMNALTDKCVSFAFLSRNGYQITKNSMIIYALLPSRRSFEMLLSTLRSEISQCIILSKEAKMVLKNALAGDHADPNLRKYETLQQPPKPPARDPAKEAADAELLKQQMKTGRVDRKLIPVPKPTFLKPSSAQTLLAPIVAQMTDYPVFADRIRIMFDVWNGYKVKGSERFGFIRIYACDLVFSKTFEGMNPIDKTLLGRETVRVLAHEFRHTQQELLWDTDIPVVSAEVGLNDHEFALNKDAYMHYKNDPGEIDARNFAEKAVNAIDDERYFRMVGRLAYRLYKRQVLAYGKLSLDFLAKKIAESEPQEDETEPKDSSAGLPTADHPDKGNC